MRRILLPMTCLVLIFMTGVIQGQEKVMASLEKAHTLDGSVHYKTLEFLIAECPVKRKNMDAPGTVTGEVLYGFDRISSGWLIYLYSPERSEKTLNVEINLDMKKVHLVVRIRDLMNNEAFQGYLFKVSVAPGQYRVLRIQTESFEPDYSCYFD